MKPKEIFEKSDVSKYLIFFFLLWYVNKSAVEIPGVGRNSKHFKIRPTINDKRDQIIHVHFVIHWD